MSSGVFGLYWHTLRHLKLVNYMGGFGFGSLRRVPIFDRHLTFAAPPMLGTLARARRA